MIIKSGGNIGINTSTPQNKLDVNGSIAIGRYAGIDSTSSGNLIMSGSLAVGTATPDLSAAVTISSTTGGLLVPVMSTTQKNAINGGTITDGVVVYDNTVGELQVFAKPYQPYWCGFSSGYVQLPNLSNLSGFSLYTSNDMWYMKIGNVISVTWTFSAQIQYQITTAS